MKAYWLYFKYVVRHKWFVFWACMDLKVPLLIALFHDWDKFLPDEFLPYAHFFYNPDGTKKQVRDKSGYYKPENTGDSAFDMAWLSHARRNKHHWQWWVLTTSTEEKVFEIPEVYLREMVADWRGAGQAQGTPDTLFWYVTNREKMKLGPKTRAWIENELGYDKLPQSTEYIEHTTGQLFRLYEDLNPFTSKENLK